MKNMHLLARPIAAAAVLGVAIIGFTGSAGATTISVSVPPVLGHGTAVSSPVVTIGSGTVAPVPGTDATVPVHGDSDVTVDNPPMTPVVPLATRPGHLASEHSSIDACIAAALLSGHSPSGCGATAADSQPPADSLSQVGSSPSLAGALSRVGACVRVALASDTSIDTCATPVFTPPSVPTTDLGSAGISVPESLPVSAAALDDGTVAGVLADNGLCSIGQQLGLSGLSLCTATAGLPDLSGGNSGANASAGPDGASGSATFSGPNAQGSGDVCLGLAAVTGVDPQRCSSASVHGLSGGTTANGSVRAGHRGKVGASSTSAAPAIGSSPSSPVNASCLTRTSSSGGTSPFRSDAAGGFAGLGLALAALGRRYRRVKRPLLG